MAQRSLMGGLGPFRPGVSRASRWVALLLCFLVLAILAAFLPPGSCLAASSRAVLARVLPGYFVGFAFVFWVWCLPLRDFARDWLLLVAWVVSGIWYGWITLGGFGVGVLLFTMFELISSSIFGGPSMTE